MAKRFMSFLLPIVVYMLQRTLADKKAFWGRKSTSTPDSFKFDAPPLQEVGWPKQLFLSLAFSLATFSLAAASLPGENHPGARPCLHGCDSGITLRSSIC